MQSDWSDSTVLAVLEKISQIKEERIVKGLLTKSKEIVFGKNLPGPKKDEVAVV